MHGMLSAAILIGVFAVTAAVCLYLAGRAFAAGRAQAQAQAHGHGPRTSRATWRCILTSSSIPTWKH